MPKKRIAPYSATFYLPKLFLNDIQDIVSLLREAGAKEIKFREGGYEYNSIEEIEKEKKTTNSLAIISDEPNISIFIEALTVIHAPGEIMNNSLEGFLSLIGKILEKNQRKKIYHVTIWTGWFIPTLIFFSILSTSNLVFGFLNYFSRGFEIAVITISLVLFSFYLYALYQERNLIRLFSKDIKSKFFLSGNFSEKVLIAFLGALFGFLFSLLR